jgi:hypothetical protein
MLQAEPVGGAASTSTLACSGKEVNCRLIQPSLPWVPRSIGVILVRRGRIAGMSNAVCALLGTVINRFVISRAVCIPYDLDPRHPQRHII